MTPHIDDNLQSIAWCRLSAVDTYIFFINMKLRLKYKIINFAEGENLIFTGKSMYPVLKDLDVLRVKPCRLDEVRVGDVIAHYDGVEERRKIAHRVISVQHDGLEVMGDNCSEADKRLVKEDDLIGKVVAVKRKENWKRLHGGKIGSFNAYLCRTRKKLNTVLHNEFFRKIYHSLLKSGFLKRYFALNKKLRVIAVKNNDEVKLQLLFGRHRVGVLNGGSQQWKIKPLFRLFVDESSLPCMKDITEP